MTEGGNGLEQREARQFCLVCHPEWKGRFSLPFALRERRPCREGPWQPTLSYPNQWHAHRSNLRLR